MASPFEPETTWKWPNLCNNTDQSNSYMTEGTAGSSGGKRKNLPTTMATSSLAANTTTLANEFDEVGNSFKRLSVKERDSAFDDLHGCRNYDSDADKEDPDVISQKLAELDAELRKKVDVDMDDDDDVDDFQNIKDGNLPTLEAYAEAYRQDRTYVEDRMLRLAFLRADLLDVKQAAKRMFQFFEHKLNLFGIEKLTQHITYHDLSDDDLEVLCSGVFQVLPVKDRAGRTVVVAFEAKRHPKTLQNYLRAHFYFFMKLLEINDERLQQRGFVAVLYNMTEAMVHHAGTGPLRQQIWSAVRLRQALPIRMAASHLCHESGRTNFMHSILSVAIRLLPRSTWHRMRLHVGSHTECSYSLMSFGIPVGSIPYRESSIGNGRGNDVDAQYPMEQHIQSIEEMKRSDDFLRILKRQRQQLHDQQQQLYLQQQQERQQEQQQQQFDQQQHSSEQSEHYEQQNEQQQQQEKENEYRRYAQPRLSELLKAPLELNDDDHDYWEEEIVFGDGGGGGGGVDFFGEDTNDVATRNVIDDGGDDVIDGNEDDEELVSLPSFDTSMDGLDHVMLLVQEQEGQDGDGNKNRDKIVLNDEEWEHLSGLSRLLHQPAQNNSDSNKKRQTQKTLHRPTLSAVVAGSSGTGSVPPADIPMGNGSNNMTGTQNESFGSSTAAISAKTDPAVVPNKLSKSGKSSSNSNSNNNNEIDAQKQQGLVLHSADLGLDDVLFGRGGPVNRFPGNIYYRNLIIKQADAYEKADRYQKTSFAASVVETIQKERGGRFVQQLPCSNSTSTTIPPISRQQINIIIDNVTDRRKKNNNNDDDDDDDMMTATTTATTATPGKGHKNKSTTKEPATVDELLWEEVDDAAARLKVASAFRTIRKHNNRKAHRP